MATLPQVKFEERRRLTSDLLDFWRYRDLLYNLTIRDLKLRYKHSVLGILWSLLNPLLMMAVFTFAFTVMQENRIPHFSVFLLAGLLPWNFFSGSVMGGASQIIGNGNLIKKVYFPREMLPVSTVLSQFINFLLGFLPLTFFLILTEIGFTRHLIWLPVILVIQLLLLIGISLLMSALMVYYRDLLMVLDVAVLGLFFLSPIFYPMELIQDEATILGTVVPISRVVRWLNPMASIVDSYRTVIYGVIRYTPEGVPIYFPPAQPALDFLLRTGVTAFVVFLLGWWVFRRLSPTFGEEI